jgi:uncharacterized OsmC-like protein
MLRLSLLPYYLMLLALIGCAVSPARNAIDWEHMDYKKIACTGENEHKPGCDVSSGVESIGKGGKR